MKRPLVLLCLLIAACSVAPGPTNWAERLSPATEPTTGLAQVVRHKATGTVLILVAPGKYFRGALEDDMGAEGISWEKPRHEVIISKPFYLGKYEVTRAQWERVMGRTAGDVPGGPHHPAFSVAWRDVQLFLKKTGFRLPTEAEWEFACQPGSPGPRLSIEEDGRWEAATKKLAWCNENSGGRLHRVGTREPNALGFHDMLGNVTEWCSDYFDPNAYERCVPSVRNPLVRTDAGLGHVRRGGSYTRNVHLCRVTARDSSGSDEQGGGESIGEETGFRVARDP